jgi:hypothetical protein
MWPLKRHGIRGVGSPLCRNYFCLTSTENPISSCSFCDWGGEKAFLMDDWAKPVCCKYEEGLDWQVETHKTKSKVNDGNRFLAYHREEIDQTPLVSANAGAGLGSPSTYMDKIGIP